MDAELVELLDLVKKSIKANICLNTIINENIDKIDFDTFTVLSNALKNELEKVKRYKRSSKKKNLEL